MPLFPQMTLLSPAEYHYQESYEHHNAGMNA